MPGGGSEHPAPKPTAGTLPRPTASVANLGHPSFWLDFAGRVGAPLFSGTLVASLLSGEFGGLHGGLLCTGIGLIALHHWGSFHSQWGMFHHHPHHHPPERGR